MDESKPPVLKRPNNTFYIKLGRKGEWEAESIAEGILRFDYRETPAVLAARGDWGLVRAKMRGVWSEDEGALSRHIKQVRCFYEATSNDMFVTFHGGACYWAFPNGPVHRRDDGTHWRKTKSGWSNTSQSGELLAIENLSGHLTKTAGFRGTISDLEAADYLYRRISGQLSPEVKRAIAAEEEMQASIIGLLKLLTWQDFELLVDLVFATSGWRRVSSLGGSQKTSDLVLELPTTGERAFVQVKSATDDAEFVSYVDSLATHTASKMFFVFHSGQVSSSDPRVHKIGPNELSALVLKAGLATWLRDKVS